jgi:hypothetical protein
VRNEDKLGALKREIIVEVCELSRTAKGSGPRGRQLNILLA